MGVAHQIRIAMPLGLWCTRALENGGASRRWPDRVGRRRGVPQDINIGLPNVMASRDYVRREGSMQIDQIEEDEIVAVRN
jgi:hypothetical protein